MSRCFRWCGSSALLAAALLISRYTLPHLFQLDRPPARTRAGRRAGVVLRGRRVRRISRPLARHGRADRRRLAVDLPLRARRHREGNVAARLLHHAVLRGARHDHSAADAIGDEPCARAHGVHLGKPLRHRVPDALRHAARPARESTAGDQPGAAQRVLAGAGADRRAVGSYHAGNRRRRFYRLRGARGAQHLPDDAQRRGNPRGDPYPQAVRA